MGKNRYFKTWGLAFVLAGSLLATATASAASFVTATQVVTIPAGSYPSTITATCPAGYTVTGGGFQEINQVANNGGGFDPATLATNPSGYAWLSTFYFMVYSSAPTAAGDGWTVTGQVMPIAPATVTVYARCMM
ncbi:hypothetical protein [Dyella kyungheensis]|uniref:Uncharacterized protein n=1 Tax=Dyella kyungheensis TaxID=1242174 RepID=A0ABS2JSU6_9GAMM|nr:hypothetical protein [Dyella kyungheensis]MBM7121936.1 hypothetical protein [Dyella kyungheensis]